MKRFKTLDKYSNEGDNAIVLLVDNEEYCKDNALPSSYGYVLLMLEESTPTFPGCLAIERNSVEELRDALTELLETYP